MKTLSLELRAGKSRKKAWRSFADRMNLEEAGSLATMLRQAEEMGTSLGATLRIFSADMRQRRILMAEEKSHGIASKIDFAFDFVCVSGAFGRSDPAGDCKNARRPVLISALGESVCGCYFAPHESFHISNSKSRWRNLNPRSPSLKRCRAARMGRRFRMN
jgi:hypothetical protein